MREHDEEKDERAAAEAKLVGGVLGSERRPPCKEQALERRARTLRGVPGYSSAAEPSTSSYSNKHNEALGGAPAVPNFLYRPPSPAKEEKDEPPSPAPVHAKLPNRVRRASLMAVTANAHSAYKAVDESDRSHLWAA